MSTAGAKYTHEAFLGLAVCLITHRHAQRLGCAFTVFALLVGGDSAVVRCDPPCPGGVAGGLWPVPLRDAIEL
jgi:hypothetical protein